MFLSVGFWLLDIPHMLVRAICKKCHDAKQFKRENKKPFIDTYAYDLGYHMSYGLTTFAIAMVFSTLVPYVPVFAMFFFVFKYYVDKYNLSFVYNTEFHGSGMIKRRVVPLSIFNVISYQVINIGFFASKADTNNKNFLYFGLTFVALECIFVTCFHYSSKRARYTKHR